MSKVNGDDTCSALIQADWCHIRKGRDTGAHLEKSKVRTVGRYLQEGRPPRNESVAPGSGPLSLKRKPVSVVEAAMLQHSVE